MGQWSQHVNMYKHNKNTAFSGILLLLSVAAISAWYYMPIYPDEIALRLQLGRFIQDKGIIYGLYAICTSNIKDTPFLFYLPALLFSVLDLTLSPVSMRIIPFIASMLSIFGALLFSIKGKNINAAMVATTAFIGVAGSGLVLARYEYAQVLNIASCLIAINTLELNSTQTLKRIFVITLLIVSCLFSLYAHIQGLLFLPLTFYLLFLHISSSKPSKQLIIVLISVFICFAITTINFHKSSCVGCHAIEQFWSNMTINTSTFKSISTHNWLVFKIKSYLSAFVYKTSYQAQYLPGIILHGQRSLFYVSLLNNTIQFIVMTNFILLVSITIYLFIYMCKFFLLNTATKFNLSIRGLNYTIILILFVSPLVFLFIYDAAQNFYRSFLINFMVAISLSMVASQMFLIRYKHLLNSYFIACGLMTLISLAANLNWFSGRLKAGYEGPSIAIKTDWKGVSNDIILLTQDCNINLTKGRIIVDDLTYDSLKRYPALYAITYLSLTGSLANMSSQDIIEIVRPTAIIARCSSINDWWRISIKKYRNDLCCVNFLQPPQTP
jgi:hypothetical protein